MIRTLAALLLGLCMATGSVAQVTPLFAISCDEADDDADTNEADSLLFTEALTGGATDTSIGLSTTVRHQADNGGCPGNTSQRSIRVNVTNGQSATYNLRPGILKPNLTQLSRSVAVHIPTSGDVSAAKAIDCITESSQTDFGCCLVQEPGRLFSVAYLGTNEGACSVAGDCDADEKCYGGDGTAGAPNDGICRKVWATTAIPAQVERCSNAVERPCTDATVTTDCPAGATCSGAHVTILEYAQKNLTSSIVECDFRHNGAVLASGVTKSVSTSPDATPVDAINSHATPASRGGIAVGALNVTGMLTGSMTLYLDSLVGSSTMRAGTSYVSSLKPLGQLDCDTNTNCNDDGAESTCRTGGKEACLNDWGVTPYLADDLTSNTDNHLRLTGTSKDQDLPHFGPQGWSTGSGEHETAMDVYAVARKAASGATNFYFGMGTLSCPEPASGTHSVDGCEYLAKKACSGDVDYPCTTTADCTPINGAWTCVEHVVQLTSADDDYVMHHLTTKSPSATETTWENEYLAVGARVSTTASTGGNRSTYVNALIANLAVQKPDARPPSTSTDWNGDGLIVQAYIGASTLYLTEGRVCQGGLGDGTTKCSRDFYCGYDSTNRDIGCEQDNDCIVCSLEHGIGCSNGGTASNTLCNFGTCNGMTGFCECATPGTGCVEDNERACSTDAECNRGPCETGDAAKCTDSCPPDEHGEGICPPGSAGWAKSMIGSEDLTADIHLVCACPGETSGQGFENRFDKVMKGRAIGVPDNEVIGSGLPGADGQVIQTPGTTASLCVFAVGTGACECTDATVADDCGGASPSCINENADGIGVCSGGAEPTRLACTRGGQCRQTHGRACRSPGEPDEINIGQSLNDSVLVFSESYAPFYKGHDSECATRSSFLSTVPSAQFGTTLTDRPVLWCPTIGTGAYQVPSTPCLVDAPTCTALAPDSTCYGQCTNGQGFCTRTNECAGQARCSLDAPMCDLDKDCTLNRSCVGGNPDLPGVTTGGRCSCESNAECPDDYLCAGPAAGPKFCRARCGCNDNHDCGAPCLTSNDCGGGTCSGSPLRCTTGSKSGTCTGTPPNATCTSGPLSDGSTMACNTTFCDTASQCDAANSALYNLVEGRCTPTSAAISATSDEGCGSTLLAERWGHVPGRSLLIRGKVNPASGRCACSGATVCSDQEALLKRGCSCASGGDCPGGSCINNVCVGGTRGDCVDNLLCAPGQRCMRCTDQLRRYQESHYGLLRQVADLAWEKLQAERNYGPCLLPSGTCAKLPSRSCSTADQCDDAAHLTISAVPLPNGRTTSGFTYPDTGCWQGIPGATWVDRQHYALTYADLYGGHVPDHRIVIPTAYNEGRMTANPPFLVDQVHTTEDGGGPAGQPYHDAHIRYDVCLDPDGDPVHFCQNAADGWTNHCTCTPGTQVTDCGTGGVCSPDGICIRGAGIACTGTGSGVCNLAGGRVCTDEIVCDDTSTGCAVGENCRRRKCFQSEANCPGTLTFCGPP